MATMSFRVSKDELAVKVPRLRDMVSDQQLWHELCETEEEGVEAVVDFLQSFMIAMDNETALGHYDYELVVDGEAIPLDAEESDERLRTLVKDVWDTEAVEVVPNGV